MTVGQNTIASEKLRSFVERIERVNVDIKELQGDRTAIYAELKANGFDAKIMRNIIKRRAKKPHDLQEFDELMDLYQHALGMGAPGPLFRLAARAADDTLTREQYIEALKPLVPPMGAGDLTMNIGGKAMRLTRDKAGNVLVQDVMERLEPAAAPKAPPKPPKVPVPDVDEEGAEEYGRQMARDNKPIIDNPFPYGDPRRARCDLGWRKETGNDGMGPDDED